jgi:hypothetical protein
MLEHGTGGILISQGSSAVHPMRLRAAAPALTLAAVAVFSPARLFDLPPHR